MPRIIEGTLFAPPGRRFGIVVARFNELVTDRLLAGCVEGFVRHGVADADIHVVKVPGSYEIPLAAKAMAETGRYDAIVCLGAVIRGSTAHFDYVAGEAGSGVGAVGRQTGVPCIFGVLTTDTMEQALDRAGGKAGNKGTEAAVCAVETADVLRRIRAAD